MAKFKGMIYTQKLIDEILGKLISWKLDSLSDSNSRDFVSFLTKGSLVTEQRLVTKQRYVLCTNRNTNRNTYTEPKICTEIADRFTANEKKKRYSRYSWFFQKEFSDSDEFSFKAIIEMHNLKRRRYSSYSVKNNSQEIIATTTKKSQNKQRASDVRLIMDLSEEIINCFPEEWDEWQHWIRDIMDSRTSMQSKGKNHRLVSLLTFYRLTRFAFHIGIDKVFILATRRATR